MRYLLDTNIISEPARDHPQRRVVSRLVQHIAACAIAAPVWFELKTGIARLPESKRRRDLRDYLARVRNAGLSVLPYDDAAAEWHAAEHARLAGLGNPRPMVDGQIAAIAVTNNLVMVTRNSKNFAFFSELQLDNWFE